MSGLRDPQEEKFATFVGSGQVRDEVDAYRMAFEKMRENRETSERKVEALLQEPRIRIRIGEIQDELARSLVDATVMNEIWLMAKLKEAVDGAIDRKNYMAALKGIELAGKHRAMQLFPHKIDHMHFKDPLAGKTRDELIEIAQRRGFLPTEPEKVIEATVVNNSEPSEVPVIDESAEPGETLQ